MNLCVENIRCSYDKRTIIDSFSCSLEQGDILCLLGPNGTGKTTLFKAILGLIPIEEGHITLDGRSLSLMTRSERARFLAHVPQAHTVPFAFSVHDVVLLGRMPHIKGFSGPTAYDSRISLEAMEELGIEHLAKRTYATLSGGEQQMVLIARALAQQPHFMLLDEPTASLDFGNQLKVLHCLRHLAARGLGILLTTHVPDHAFLLESRILLMHPEYPPVYLKDAETLTPDMLRAVYGVEAAIADISHEGQRLRICRPVLLPSHPGENMS